MCTFNEGETRRIRLHKNIKGKKKTRLTIPTNRVVHQAATDEHTIVIDVISYSISIALTLLTR